MSYSCIYSKRDHARVGWHLKDYLLKEQNVLPQHLREGELVFLRRSPKNTYIQSTINELSRIHLYISYVCACVCMYMYVYDREKEERENNN